jgi:hypothetical protein
MGKIPLAKHNDIVKAFPPDRADQHTRFAMAIAPQSAGHQVLTIAEHLRRAALCL